MRSTYMCPTACGRASGFPTKRDSRMRARWVVSFLRIAILYMTWLHRSVSSSLILYPRSWLGYCSLFWYSSPVFCRASPAPPETNGKRMAQGLPPLPPKSIFRGSRTGTAVQRRMSPSAVPFVTYTGRLQVRREDGTSIGTVDSSLSGINSVRSENDLLVKMRTPMSGDGLFDMVITNPGFPVPLFFGIEGSHLAHDIQSIAKFINANQTHPNWVPPSDPQISSQSAIWSIDPTTRNLNVHWINSDGSKPDIMLAWDSQSRELLVVGDLELTNQLPDISASSVNLYLVD